MDLSGDEVIVNLDDNIERGVLVRVGDRVNGKKIVKIERNIAMRRTMDLITDEDEIMGWGDRMRIKFTVESVDWSEDADI